MVKYTPGLIKITFRSFARPFSGDSCNTALTAIVATNVCVTRMIVATNVKRLIDQIGLRPEGRSVTTHIHDWIRCFSF
jgi:hypothetical protein